MAILNIKKRPTSLRLCIQLYIININIVRDELRNQIFSTSVAELFIHLSINNSCPTRKSIVTILQKSTTLMRNSELEDRRYSRFGFINVMYLTHERMTGEKAAGSGVPKNWQRHPARNNIVLKSDVYF